MLIVQRRVGERIVIGNGIEVMVTEVGSRGVRLGVIAPRGVLVLRGEVHDSIVAANTAATSSPPLKGALSAEATAPQEDPE
jgi:carbon storage regulator